MHDEIREAGLLQRLRGVLVRGHGRGDPAHRGVGHFLVKSDLVLGVGCSFAKGSFSFPIPADKAIVQIVSDGTTLDKDHKVKHAVIGDAKLVLRQVIDEVRKAGASKKDGVTDEVKRAKDAFLDTWLTGQDPAPPVARSATPT